MGEDLFSQAPYYNTTNLEGEDLEKENGKAHSLSMKIVKLFKAYPETTLTPFEVQDALRLFRTPITSFRRAMSNLTKAGILEKTNEQRKGEYGKPNYCWKYCKVLA